LNENPSICTKDVSDLCLALHTSKIFLSYLPVIAHKEAELSDVRAAHMAIRHAVGQELEECSSTVKVTLNTFQRLHGKREAETSEIFALKLPVHRPVNSIPSCIQVHYLAS
jgi:hypothetical protein